MFETFLHLDIQPQHSIEVSYAYGQLTDVDKLAGKTSNEVVSTFPEHRAPFDDFWIEGFLPKIPDFPFKVWAGQYWKGDGQEFEVETYQADGNHIGTTLVHYEGDFITDIGAIYRPDGGYESAVSSVTVWNAFAFSLMHCKNIIMEGKMSRQMRRQIERKKPRVEYHILDLSPSFKKKYQPTGNHRDLPLHYTRGHYAEYGTNGKGLLFGKLEGRFWIPAHLKGNPKRGLILADHVLRKEAIT